MSEPVAPPPAPIESWEVLDLLAALVQKSLVVYEEDEQGQGRYQLLETVRQYARDRLLEAGDADAVRDRHRDWFLALAERAAPELYLESQAEWLDRLETEHDNLRAALAWSVAHGQVEEGLRLGGALGRLWMVRDYWREGRERLAELLALPGAEAGTAARATALSVAGQLASFQGDHGAAQALLEEGVAIRRELGSEQDTAWALYHLGCTARNRGDRAAARAPFEECLAISRAIGCKEGIARSLWGLGDNACAQGEYGTGRALLEESLATYRELGDKLHIATSLTDLGALAWSQGEYGAARALLEESVAIYRALGSKGYIHGSLDLLGQMALEHGEYGAARALYEESLAIRRDQGDRPGIVGSLLPLATVAQAQGDDERARACREEVRSLYRELGDKIGESNACMGEGHQLLERGCFAAARSCYEEGLALRRAAGDPWNIAWALLEVGHAAWLQEEPDVTRPHAVEALALFRELRNREGLLAALEILAAAALAQDQMERAARLLGAAEALREGRGLPGPHWWRRPRERIGVAARAASLDQEFSVAWTEGRRMKMENAIADALEAIDPDGSAN